MSSEQQIIRRAMSILSRQRPPAQCKGGRPPKYTRCPQCRELITARAMRYHPRVCLSSFGRRVD